MKDKMSIKDVAELIRVKHYLKNVLIFLPVICANKLNLINFYQLVIGFAIFSLLCSCIYIINDLKDIEKDKLCFRKKQRPLAAGKIKPITAIGVAGAMLLIALMLSGLIDNKVALLWGVIYLVVNISYSLGLKNVALVDIILLCSGFVIRVYYGAAIVNVRVSDWLFLTILSASLFLAFGKRKKELQYNAEIRNVLREYSEAFLDKFQYVALTLTILFYSLWVIEQSKQYLFLTIPLLITIFMKYCLFVEKSDEGDPITILYKDKSLCGLCLIYALSMVFLLTM